MTPYTERLRDQQGVEVTHEAAAAVCADLAVQMDVQMDGAHRLAVENAVRAGVLPQHMATGYGLVAFRLGFELAVDLVRQAVLAHRNPEHYEQHGGTD